MRPLLRRLALALPVALLLVPATAGAVATPVSPANGTTAPAIPTFKFTTPAGETAESVVLSRSAAVDASGVLSATYNSLGQEVSSPDSYPVAPGFSQVTPELALLAGPYWWQVRSRDTVVGDMWSGLSTFRVAPYIKKLRIENAGNPGVVTTVGHPNAVISAIWFDNFENGRAQLSLYRGTKLVYRSAKVRTEDPVTDPRSEDGVSFTVRFTKAGKPAPLNVRLKAVVRVTSGTYGANAVSFFKMPTCIDSSC